MTTGAKRCAYMKTEYWTIVEGSDPDMDGASLPMRFQCERDECHEGAHTINGAAEVNDEDEEGSDE